MSWSLLLERVDPLHRLSELGDRDLATSVSSPPALVPLAPTFGGASGLWVEPFSSSWCFAEWRSDEGCVPICRTIEDYVRWVAIEALGDEHPEEVESLLAATGVTLALAAVVERLGGGLGSREVLSELYRVERPVVTHVDEPQRVFAEAIGARSLERAWSALNSPGWDLEATRRALVVLQDLSNDEVLGLVASGWLAATTTRVS